MMEPILKASPTFVPIWNEFVAEWQAEADGLPIYLVLSDLARHMARLLNEGEKSQLRELFGVIENWHLYGDAYVKEAATVGLLEDLQNTNIVGDGKPPLFVKFLGPESKRWWVKVENFWKKGELLQDD